MYKSLRQILGTGTHAEMLSMWKCELERRRVKRLFTDVHTLWNAAAETSSRHTLQTGVPKKTKHWSRIRNEEDRVSLAVDCPRGLNRVPEASRHQRTFTSRTQWPHEVVKTDMEGNQVRIFPPNDCDEKESREWGVWQLQLSLFPSDCSPFAGKY